MALRRSRARRSRARRSSAFQIPEGDARWDEPPGTDLLVTHGPPDGILAGRRGGCVRLRASVREVPWSLARVPSDEERALAEEYLAARANDAAAWAELCHVLVNVKEFIFLR